MERLEQWAAGFVQWLGPNEPLTPWTIINSEFVLMVFVAVTGWALNRKGNRLKQQMDDREEARQIAEELEADAADSEAELPAGSTIKDTTKRMLSKVGLANSNYDEAVGLVERLKSYVDQKLDRQRDGRKLRKYKNIGKRDYRVRVIAARDDNMIKDGDTVINLLGAFETWRSHRTKVKPVSTETLEFLRDVEQSIDTDETQEPRQARRRRRWN